MSCFVVPLVARVSKCQYSFYVLNIVTDLSYQGEGWRERARSLQYTATSFQQTSWGRSFCSKFETRVLIITARSQPQLIIRDGWRSVAMYTAPKVGALHLTQNTFHRTSRAIAHTLLVHHNTPHHTIAQW